MIQEGINEIESPRKPYRESPGRRVNGVEVPHLDTGDDLDGLKSPSPRAAIRTDAEVSPLQLTKKDKSKQRQEKLQEEKDNAANEAPADPQPSDQSKKEEGMLFELIHLIFITSNYLINVTHSHISSRAIKIAETGTANQYPASTNILSGTST